MEVKRVNEVVVKGKDEYFKSDTYEMTIRKSDMYIKLTEGDFGEDVSVGVAINPENAVKLAETIIEFYRGGKVSNENN